MSTFENLHNYRRTNIDQTSLDNSPDSGVSVGSNELTSSRPVKYMANQGPMYIPHPNLQKAFKPIGALTSNSNSPSTMNLTQLSQNPQLSAPNRIQWKPQPWLQTPHSQMAQANHPRANNFSHPLSVNLTRPASPLPKVSPSLSQRFSSHDRAVSSPRTPRPVSQNQPGVRVFRNRNSTSTPSPSSTSSITSSISTSSITSSMSLAKNGSSATKVSPTTSSITQATEGTSPQQDSQTCSCDRSPKIILCKACGEMCQGRIRQKCKAHPNQIFLMDFTCCPYCQSENLKEIDYSKKV
ncbi:hypothetical protein EGW08_008214 [Elysia chlorotica]|uniref:Uncharacterized protein n=1 Tax=Elysia chlorotica TaxID=188477 RepID=A0A3S1BHH1_ELYCH|nr:hypothetical protein EGW08_008214 [Elysia chlorotica]